MSAAVGKFTRIDPISWIVIRYPSGAHQDIHCSKAGINGNIVHSHGTATQLDAGIGVSDIEIGSR